MIINFVKKILVFICQLFFLFLPRYIFNLIKKWPASPPPFTPSHSSHLRTASHFNISPPLPSSHPGVGHGNPLRLSANRKLERHALKYGRPFFQILRNGVIFHIIKDLFLLILVVSVFLSLVRRGMRRGRGSGRGKGEEKDGDAKGSGNSE